MHLRNLRSLAREMARPVGLAGLLALVVSFTVTVLEVSEIPAGLTLPDWLLDTDIWLYAACALVVIESVSRRLPESNPLRRFNGRFALRLSWPAKTSLRLIWYSLALYNILLPAFLVGCALHAIRLASHQDDALLLTQPRRAEVSHGIGRNPMLALAVMRNDPGEVHMLLRRGADPETRCAAANVLRDGSWPISGPRADETVLAESERLHEDSITAQLRAAGAR